MPVSVGMSCFEAIFQVGFEPVRNNNGGNINADWNFEYQVLAGQAEGIALVKDARKRNMTRWIESAEA